MLGVMIPNCMTCLRLSFGYLRDYLEHIKTCPEYIKFYIGGEKKCEDEECVGDVVSDAEEEQSDCDNTMQVAEV